MGANKTVRLQAKKYAVYYNETVIEVKTIKQRLEQNTIEAK